MSATDDLTCKREKRRDLVRKHALNGIDYVEVSGSVLCVHFLDGPPENIEKENIVITGGVRIKDLKVVQIRNKPTLDVFQGGCLQIELDREGDFSPYKLCFVEAEDGEPTGKPLEGLDPRYSCTTVYFRTDCPAVIDCKQEEVCPGPERAEPEISYLAKDYATFRQLMLDRLAVTMPSWRERHVPDLGIALVEVMAYVGDHLSYYQDAAGTEQYLDTARLRISVRRHARLVDYALHDGCNARTFVALEVASDAVIDPSLIRFTTHWTREPKPVVLHENDVEGSSYVAFEPVGTEPIALYQAHNKIDIHTWGNEECCLDRGATHATLVNRELQLKPGDFLLFEELACPSTATQADIDNDGAPDADAKHRHVVRLTHVTENYDPVLEMPLLEVEWAREDALPFPLCISALGRAPECELLKGVSVARGNIVLADHGTTVSEELPEVPPKRDPLKCEDVGDLEDVPQVADRYRPALRQAPLTFAQPIKDGTPAALLLAQEPRAALPSVRLTEEESGEWIARTDLLDSGPDDPHFVAEVDDDGRAHLRFGDGILGQFLEPGMTFTARYRVGNGRAGMIGQGALTHVVFRNNKNDVIERVRNPLPSMGAVNPEPVSEAKMLASTSFRSSLQRAVIADDYAELAQYVRYPRRNPRVQSAAARMRWSGSWYEAGVAIDALGGTAGPPLLGEVSGLLHRYRRMGHDLRVGPAIPVPLDLEIEVCVDPDYLAAHVHAALLEVFSSRAFFHPDKLTFGNAIYISAIVAAAQAVDGVRSAEVKKLVRLWEGVNPDFAKGYLALGPLEVARLDNDAVRSENGVLSIVTRGGR